MAHEFFTEAQKMAEDLVKWRRDLHQMPELGLKLPQTAAYIQERLREMGIKSNCSESSNVVALIGSGEPCFMLRSDMDALPVEERSGEPFSSSNGNMHACGHDMHAAILLGAAKMLKAREPELKGTVKLLFQSGEEVFGGAVAAMEEGVLENPKVEAAFAAHVFASLPFGLVAYGDKALSSAYGFHIDITGKGAHGSTPEAGVSPINAAVHIYLGLQELIAREVSGMDEVTMTIGQLHSGAAANVIPEKAWMEGTLRTFNKDTAEYLIRRITEMAEKTAEAYRAQAAVKALYNVPMVDNNPELNLEFVESIRELDESLVPEKALHVMGSEDFAFITEKIPAVYMVLGAGVPDKTRWRAQHNPEIVFNEKVLPTGAAAYAKIAVDYLKKRSR